LRSEVIYVHQHPYLFHTTVAANIGYGLSARRMPSQARDRVVAEAMAWAGVEHLRAVPPQKLSGGEKQRVALARAHVLHPKVLLLDEPTANLDAEARGQIVTLLGQLADRDTCVVVACHDREIIGLPCNTQLHLDKEGLALVA
jgi:tungstate transport system ATP-binding protein